MNVNLTQSTNPQAETKNVITALRPATDPLTYTYEEALKSSKEYFDGDELAAGVWIGKYALKDSVGRIYEKNPDQMHQRLATEIARIESKYKNPLTIDQIYNVLKKFRYIIPQGGPMAGIGNQFQVGSLSNCFVIGNKGASDSYGGIMKIDQEQVQLMKRRGGVGHDLSHIRPLGSPVMNSALTSTGIVPFMERYSNSTREVAQDGRRGALMLSMSVRHPDAEKFIDAKLDGTKVTGANVSIKLDDNFMQAVINDGSYQQKYPVNSSSPLVTKEIKAKELWDKIIHNAWQSAEPGILFWDTIIRESLPDCYADLGFKTVSTNPCGEIPLCPYDSCRLLAINLLGYVQEPFTPSASFDFEKFKKHAGLAQRIMDDIIDLEIEKIHGIIDKLEQDPEDDEIKGTEVNLWKKIKQKCIEGRRAGIGVTAEGDMLAALNIRYGSEESISFCEKMHRTLAVEVYRSSVQLAKERGAFPVYDPIRERKNPFINRIKENDPALIDEMEEYGRRNIALLTIAPTGTTSLMSQTTSGIEPLFRPFYRRRKKVNPNDQHAKVDFVDGTGDSWEEFCVFHKGFLDWFQTTGGKQQTINNMTEEELNELVRKSPYYRSTANDIDWVKKVNLQGTIQKWVDHSISVTVNVPNEANEDLIANIYKTAWESGCKGITVYRDGSRSGVLIGEKAKKIIFNESKPPKRPKVLDAEVIRFQNNHEKWIAVIGLLDNKPYEIFTGQAENSFYLPPWVNSGSVIKSRLADKTSRYDFQFTDKEGYSVTIEGLSRSFDKEYWNYAKLISGVLRHGMPLVFVTNLISQLDLKGESLNTWKNGVSRALKKYIADGSQPVDCTCVECGEPALSYQEGCLICTNCGHSHCG